MATPAKPTKRRARRAPASESAPGSKTLRDRSLHFRLPRAAADALAKAAAAERRTVSAWVAICVEDRLRSGGYLS
jgi:hypothetical protein